MHRDSLLNWVNQQMIRGRNIFTKEDVKSLGLLQTDDSLNTALSRLVSKGVIVSPWQNFYVTVPTEYRLKGKVPPSFYIDKLMTYLGHNYYVSLLSAAALNGAGHQRSMVFQVTADGGQIRSANRNGVRLEFTLRSKIPFAFIQKVKTQMGYMNVSSPELTALDIVDDEEKVGGLSRVTEVLAELAESMHFGDDKADLIMFFNTPVIQRLGYLLNLISENELADNLLKLAQQKGKTFRKVRLKQSKQQSDDMPIDKKWKIIINQKIEIDEL